VAAEKVEAAAQKVDDMKKMKKKTLYREKGRPIYDAPMQR